MPTLRPVYPLTVIVFSAGEISCTVENEELQSLDRGATIAVVVLYGSQRAQVGMLQVYHSVKTTSALAIATVVKEVRL